MLMFCCVAAAANDLYTVKQLIGKGGSEEGAMQRKGEMRRERREGKQKE